MTTVFISYSRANQSIINTLIQELQDLGLNIWIDRSGIRGGTIWRKEIVSAIKSCDIFLLCMTSASVASENVRRELDIASSSKKKIIPLRLEKVSYPLEWEYELAGVQWIDYDENNWAARLLDAIGVSQEAPALTQRPPKQAPDKPEKRFRWGWAAIAIPVLAFFWIALTYSQLSGTTPTPTAAATTEPAPTATMITDTPFPTDTPTLVPPLVLFEDTFMDNRNDWFLANNSFSIEYGKLISSFSCTSRTTEYCGDYLLVPFSFPKNFRLEVDVTAVDLSPGTWIGIGFQARRNGKDFYYANYYLKDRTYELRATYSQNDQGLIPKTFTNLMMQDAGSTNRFGIELNDTAISPILNGQKLAEGQDDHLSAAGDSYLIVYISKGGFATIELDNLTVEEVK